MDRAWSPDVEQAAKRLSRPRTRAALGAKRALDILLATAMLVALAPVLLLVVLSLAFGGDGRWVERSTRLGRDGRPIRLLRFATLPGSLGRALEHLGARELPLLLSVLRGRLSFVGPRPLPSGSESGHTGPRRLMAPGLIGPAVADGQCAGMLDDAYVTGWTLHGDLRRLLSPRRHAPRPVSTGD